MLRSEGINCEIPMNNSFSTYTDLRRYSTSVDSYTGHSGYNSISPNFKSYECNYQSASDSGVANSDAVYEQIGSGGSVAASQIVREPEEDDGQSAHDEFLSFRKQSAAVSQVGKEEHPTYAACKKYPMFPQKSQYSLGFQNFASGPDYSKHGYNGGSALYPVPFQRQSAVYTMPMYPESFGANQPYYHGAMSPAIGHSPPGMLPMGCVPGMPGGMGFYPQGSVCVYLCNRELWAKFHQHTCEMIITKQGR
ncbi:hypothetical protein DPMN_072883 [Dreissena polymorpha]|uniref:T-box domain-containing protein n=1 Tax=Dreissena polymorpha TaxID=45954 RepID=A0A9D4BY35_DREPO|nr:hypothetical protein DPMN_072883 [Dreissena polymorpha]